VKVNGQELLAFLDTGATISAAAKKYVPDGKLKRSDSIPLQIGSGDYIYSLGSTVLTLTFGDKVLRLHAVVVDGLLTRHPRILIDGEELPFLCNQRMVTKHKFQEFFGCSRRKVLTLFGI